MIPTIPTIQAVNTATLPNGEKVGPKEIAAKVQGMFMEMMIKSMEDSVPAEDGLFGKSSSSEIYRGMLREHLGASMSQQLSGTFDRQLQQKIESPAAAPDSQGVSSPVHDLDHSSSHSDSSSSDGELPVSGRITSPVGWRRDPINGAMKFHKGTDIAAARGTEVKAVADGVVVESGPKGGYGNAVVIETEDGRKMLYGHNQANLVRVGDRVQRGEAIAEVGSTGRATGPHVHFEIMEQ